MLNLKHNFDAIKATVKNIIVAFIYTVIFFVIIILIFHENLSSIASTIDLISINTNKEILKDVKIDETTKNLASYPSYGTKYGEITISSLNIKQPVYFGDSLSILKKGVGHSSGSYFPGEGGSILYMGHNFRNVLGNLINIKIDDLINIKTTYGEFTYQVYDTQVINYKETDKVPIQRDEEILMIYTCYQPGTIGHTEKRFVAYAKLIESEMLESEAS